MKKSIILIISSILIIATFAISVAAAGAVATTESKSCAKGGTVTLNVNVSGASGITSGAVEVIYDKSVLELVDAKWHTDGALLSTFDKATDKGAFAYQAGKNLNGKVFSVTFKVLDNAPIGKTDVECKIQLKNGSNDISVTNSKGSVDVTCKHSFTEKNNQFLASAASCTSPDTYYYACSICGEKGSTTYTVGSALPHTFDKKVTTTTYLVKSVTCANEAEYYYSCSCGAKGSETFTADASWSHNYSENWFISADGHWHQCLACGAKKDDNTHAPNANNICGICQFVTSNETHYHDFGSAWVSSNDAHWHECSCGLKNDMELHGWGEGVETKPATEAEDGEKLYTCSACGKTKTEVIDKLPTEKPNDNTNTEKPNENTNVDTPSAPISTGEIILIAGAGMLSLVVVEAAAFVVYKFIIKKKQNKISENNNSSESDSKEPETDGLDDSADSSEK